MFPYIVSPDGTTLSFLDDPTFHALPGDPPSTNPTPGHFSAFSTSLVGVGPGIDNIGNPVSTPLFSWTWNSTYNGHAGGVDQTASRYPIDPGSGTGAVTITSINGVPQTPPRVTCTVTPTTLWPPNGKAVLVPELCTKTRLCTRLREDALILRSACVKSALIVVQ